MYPGSNLESWKIQGSAVGPQMRFRYGCSGAERLGFCDPVGLL